jgi:hypothetical protein
MGYNERTYISQKTGFLVWLQRAISIEVSK